MGKYVVGSSEPYDYLVKVLSNFTLTKIKRLIEKNNFKNVEYRNLSNSISTIHSGWKI